MKKLKNSLMVLLGFTAIVGLIALATPTPGRGQGNGAPPTRDVNVVNTPSVNVVNPPTSPVLVRDVDSGREPFQDTRTVFINDGIQGVQEIAFAVPAGKRFVIESLSASIGVRGSDTPTNVSVATRLAPGDFFGSHHIAVSRQAVGVQGQHIYVGTHSVRGYAGPGTSVVVQVSRNDFSDVLTGSVTISGYFVSVP